MTEERISRSAGSAFAAQMVGAVLTSVLTIYLARALSAREYGSLTFALSVVVLATLFADLGITTSAGRFLAEHRNDPAAAADVLRTSIRLKLRVGLAASGLLFVLAGPICNLFGTGAALWPLRVLALSLLAQSIFLLLLGAFIAIGQIRYNVVIATAESVVEVTSSVVLVVLGAGATGAATGNALGMIAGLGVGLLVAKRVFGTIGGPRPATAPAEPVVSARQILTYARPLVLVDAAFRVFASVDVLLIAAIVGGGAPVAAFGLSMRLAAFLDYPAAAVASAVAPRLARTRARDAEMALFTRSLRYLLMLQMLFTAPLVIWSRPIIELIFGQKYSDAPAVLQTLAPYVFLAGIAQITTLTVNYLGEARRRVPIAIAMLSVNVLVDVILLPKIGVVAGAIGTSAAYALWVPAHLWILHRRAGLQLRALGFSALRICVAGGAFVAALAALGTGSLSVLTMAIGAIVGPLAYLLALLAVRELKLGEVASLRGALLHRAVA